jgi:hypothetical protein
VVQPLCQNTLRILDRQQFSTDFSFRGNFRSMATRETGVAGRPVLVWSCGTRMLDFTERPALSAFDGVKLTHDRREENRP